MVWEEEKPGRQWGREQLLGHLPCVCWQKFSTQLQRPLKDAVYLKAFQCGLSSPRCHNPSAVWEFLRNDGSGQPVGGFAISVSSVPVFYVTYKSLFKLILASRYTSLHIPYYLGLSWSSWRNSYLAPPLFSHVRRSLSHVYDKIFLFIEIISCWHLP